MKHVYSFLRPALVVLLLVWMCADAGAADTGTASAIPPATSQPLFVVNRGQWDSRALFHLSVSPALHVWGTAEGVVYDYRREEVHHGRRDGRLAGRVLRMTLAGARTPVVEPVHTAETRFNYFLGNDASRWVTDVPGAREMLYRNVYLYTDMRLYTENGLPRYDFIVRPGGSPGAIALSFDGAQSVQVADREVRLRVTDGDIVHGGLFAYQLVDGVRREVPCRFVQRSHGLIGIEVGEYDRTQTLVIDPLVYSTFVGGTLGDEGYGIAVDNAGNMYIVGTTVSQDYPTTTGAYDTTRTGAADIVVSKITSSGANLRYSTYIGGSEDDFGYDIAVDAMGRVALTGCSFSADFPVSNLAFDVSLGGDRDIIVVRLSDNGSRLEGSTYLGGNNWDEGYGIAVDAGGTVYVTGMTTSADYPTMGAFDDSYNGAQDVVITKMSWNATTLLFSSFLGGVSGDQGNAIALGNGGTVLVAGTTGSTDFQTTSGAFDRTFNGGVGTTDGFAAAVTAQGTLQFATYLGGNGDDEARGIAPDGQGGVIVGGWTSVPGVGFPVTAGAFDTDLSGIDGFLARLNAAGSSMIACTYLGQSDVDQILDVAVDAAGIIYAAGYTQSSSLPTTTGAHDATYNGGVRDAFLAKFTVALTPSSFLYGTYLGGNNYDEARSIAVDGDANAYLSGITRSGNFPTTIGAISRTFGGMSDAFVAKIGTGEPFLVLDNPTGGETWCAGSTQKISWRSRSLAYVRIELSANGGASYPVVLADSVPAPLGTWVWSIPLSIAPGAQYRIRLVGLGGASEVREENKVDFSISAPPVITAQPRPVTACVGADAVLQATVTAFPTAAVQWQWSSDGVNWNDVPAPGGQQNPLVLANVQLTQNNLQYRVVLSNLCRPNGVVSSTATLTVRAQPRVLRAPAGAVVCRGEGVVLDVAVDEPGVSYQWRKDGAAIPGATGRTLTIANAVPATAGRYDVVVTGACPPAVISTAAVVSVQLPPDVTLPPVFRTVVCAGEVRDTTMTLTNAGPLDLTLRVVGISNPRFSIVAPADEFTVPAGGSRTVTLRFTPTRAQLEQAELVLSTQPCNHEVRIALGARMDSVRLVTSPVSFQPLYQCDSLRTAVVRILNTGTVKMPVQQVLFSQPDFSLVAPAVPFVVEPNGRWVDAVVQFRSDGATTPVVATARFLSDTCSALETVAELSVQRGTLQTRPSVGVVDFGTLASCDAYTDKSFLLFNTGTFPLTVDSIAVDNAAFGVVSPAADVVLKPGELTEITVRFTGGPGGESTGRLTVYEQTCRSFSTVELRGRKAGSTLMVGNTSLAMGTYLACRTIPDTVVTLVNLDADTVVVQRAQVDAPFAVVAPAFPVVLASGDSLPVTVRTGGTDEGIFTGQALFEYTTPRCSSAVSVALSASRLKPAVLLVPASIHSLSLEACESFRDTSVVLRNDGRTMLTLERVEGTAGLSLLTSLPVSVRPGEDVELSVRVEPEAATMPGLLHLFFAECDTTATLGVDVRARGVSFALTAPDGGDTLHFDEVLNCGVQSRTQRIRIAVTVSDAAPTDLSASLVSLQPSGPFAVALAPGTVLSAGEQWFDVTFTPTDDGDYTAQLSVTFLPCGSTRTVVLRGRKVRGLIAAPGPVDFGIVQQGGVRTMTMTYTNTGTAAVEAQSVAVDAPFVVRSTTPPLPAVLAPGGTVVVEVEYNAGVGREEGRAVLLLAQPCADSVVVALAGEGKDLPTTLLTGLSIDFGDVQVNTRAVRTLIVQNKGTADAVLYGAPDIRGPDAALFSLLSAPASVVPPGEYTSFDVAFDPTTVGDKNAVCRIEYNGIRLDLGLTGRGVDRGPALSVVALPDTAATPYTRGLRLPLTLTPGANFAYALVDSFTAELRFNNSLFRPDRVEYAAIIGDTLLEGADVTERVLTVTGYHRDTAELCVLVGDVLLGDALSTPLTVSFRWHNPDVLAETRNGRLLLEGVREGDLVRSKGIAGFLTVGPNPASEELAIEVRVIEDGGHTVEMIDVVGKEVWSVSWGHASAGGRQASVYQFAVPVSQMASGAYTLRFRTPGVRTDSRTVVIVR